MYHSNLLVHCKRIAESVELIGGESELDFETFRFSITASGKYLEMFAEFLTDPSSNQLYSSELTENVYAFSGWRHEPRRSWPLADDRIEFRKYCSQNGVIVPAEGIPENNADSYVVVKMKHRSDVSSELLGPSLASELSEEESRPASERYVEKFILGDPFCAWYWQGKLICFEKRTLPLVSGDSKRTVRQLIETNFFGLDWLQYEKRIASMCKMQDVGLDTVLREGLKIAIDFRFQSALHPMSLGTLDVLESIVGTSVHRDLADAGPLLAAALPEAQRRNTLFTVNGVIDNESKVWFLSMDPARYTHPDAYPAIISTYFGVQLSTISR